MIWVLRVPDGANSMDVSHLIASIFRWGLHARFHARGGHVTEEDLRFLKRCMMQCQVTIDLECVPPGLGRSRAANKVARTTSSGTPSGTCASWDNKLEHLTRVLRKFSVTVIPVGKPV